MQGKAGQHKELGVSLKRGAYFMSYSVASLRGIDGLRIDKKVMKHQTMKVSEGPLMHVVILFLVIFKVDTGSQHHLQDVVN